MRRALLVYQDTWLRAHRGAANGLDTVREGRRVRWLDEVLRPLGTCPANTTRRLRVALALTLGIDSIVIMKDVFPARQRRDPRGPRLLDEGNYAS